MRNRTALALTVAGGIALVAGGLYLIGQRAARGAQAPAIVLYSGINFTGRSLTLTDTAFDLPVVEERDGTVFDWNDEVRSVRVLSGTWRVYQHGRGNTALDATKLARFDVRAKPPASGWSALLSGLSTGPLEIPSPAAGGLHRDISSVELISPENLPDWAFDFRR